MYSDREILYFLQSIPGIGNKTIRQLWNYFPSSGQLFEAKEEELRQILKPGQTTSFLRAREALSPAEKMAELYRKGIRYYSIFDWDYPMRLRAVADAPLALFVWGELPPEDCMTAAVVGARYHSFYGAKHTKYYSGLLAEKEIGVVSGMAKGIDSIAQEAAIEKGGKTYAVLGCGVDVCYPEESRKLYEKIPLHGGIISEYLPGTLPQAGLFPQRNRIISALGDILLVMEAKEKSGTLITVDMALEQGKEIWALPGRADDALSAGCNRLIAQGAGILASGADFMGELDLLKEKYEKKKGAGGRCGWKSGILKPEGAGNLKPESAGNLKAEGSGILLAEPRASDSAKEADLDAAILSLLRYTPLSLEAVHDGLYKKTRVSRSVQELSVRLLDLCMEGKIRQVNGGFYITV